MHQNGQRTDTDEAEEKEQVSTGNTGPRISQPGILTCSGSTPVLLGEAYFWNEVKERSL